MNVNFGWNYSKLGTYPAIQSRAPQGVKFGIVLTSVAAALVLAGCSGGGGKTATTNQVPLVATTTSLPNGQVGSSYSATLAATGGTLPYKWTIASGSLPTGLSLNGSAGTITGTPTASVNATALKFTITDSSSPAQSQSVNLSLTINASGLTITTSSLPNGQVGIAYSATLAATGGASPYKWAITSGTLPAGLSLNGSAGTITGTPTASVNATALKFTVTDSSSPAQSQSVNLSLTINASGLTITTSSLPNGQVGIAYSATLAATGGASPYTWTITSGTLPTGLSLNASAGTITGTPTSSVNATVLKFTVTDSSSPAQSQSVNLSLTINASGLTITTSSLPNGQVGSPYSATLAATGGISPYTWTITSGTLPAGLSLNGSAGTITGTPTASANATSLVFGVKDSSATVQSQSVTLSITVDAANLTVGVSPKRAALVTGQTLSITATTNDVLGVNWSVSGTGCSGTACGTFSASNSKTGVAVTFTAASSPGVYTINATSAFNGAVSASLPVAVTDLAGVTTYHNNLSRNGANTQEYALTAASVATSSFGKLYGCAVDGAIYAQPLWMSNLTISSTKRNVVFVATQHDSLYAFDADNNSNPCVPLWHVNLVDSNHGGVAGETSIPSGITGAPIPSADITPEVGVTGTPVIDPGTKTLYVVSKSWVSSSTTFYQRLHAIDLLTGNEKFSGPVAISATFPGTGDGGSITSFLPRTQNQRPGLALVNGVVYIAWSSHGDDGPYYGWVIGYSASNLSQVAVFNDAPNVTNGGIWMSGGAPAADSSNNLYLLTGNAIFDALNASAPNNDYGDAFLKLSSNLAVVQYFSPSNQAVDNSQDLDFGAGGAAVLADLPVNGSNPTHLVIGGGKDGALYLLNRDNLGGAGDTNAWQMISGAGGVYATGAFWNSHFYIGESQAALSDYVLSATTAKLSFVKTATAPVFGFPGATPSVSSMPDDSNGIVWALDQTNYCTEGAPACGQVILHAYDATNIATELWNSSQGTGNAAGNAVKFTVPTVANGKVFVGTRGNNSGNVDSSTSTPGELDIYGLFPN